jgi:hypothetical protein
MASTYTPLGIELMATGENAGTWGTKTNTNLNIIEQISGGYSTQAVTDSGTPTALSVSDGSTGAAMSHRMIEFTGTISGARVVTIPLDTQTFYFLRNSTSGANTLQFKYVSGSGSSVTFSATDKGDKVVFATANDGTNPDIKEVALGLTSIVEDTSPQLGGNLDTNSFNIAFDDAHGITDENANEQLFFSTTGSAINYLNVTNAAASGDPKLSALGGDTNIDLAISPKGSGEVVIGTGSANATLTSSGAHDLVLDTNSGTNSGNITITDAANGNITLTPNGSGKVVVDVLTFPNADGSANQILTTNGSGVLSFVDNSGGTDWQAVKTSSTFTAVAGQGYFINTTSNAIEMDLPAGTLGDEVSFADYAGTFDTNALTIDPNGSEKIMGSTASLTVSVERAANTLVYTDGTQGWLLKNK